MAIVVLTSPFPSLHYDKRNVVAQLRLRNNYLSQLAMHVPRIEFSKPSKHLVREGRVDITFFDGLSNLNEKGRLAVVFALEAKFRCAGLCALYNELRDRSDV